MPLSRPLPPTIGKYTVLKELGRGGMGVVYLAEDEALDRKVAIKMMLPQAAKKTHARERFLREARAMGRIKSDHVITVHDINEDETQPYFVMPFLEGQPLDKLLERDDRLPLKSILDLCIDFAQGVADAHNEGIIHRDLKPANLFVEAPKNRGKVLDFGLTRISENTKVSQVGALIGSLSYMPLEQASRLPVDHRADIYSLGVVFYEMCTRTLPFDAETEVQILYALMQTEPKRVEDLNRQVPPKFVELIHRMLQREVEDRPQSMAEVLEVLHSLRGERTTSAVKLSPPSAKCQIEREESLPVRKAIRETPSGHRTREESSRSRSRTEQVPTKSSTLPSVKYVGLTLCMILLLVALASVFRGSSDDGENDKRILLAKQQEEQWAKEIERLQQENEDRDLELKKLEAESKRKSVTEQQKTQDELDHIQKEREDAERLRRENEARDLELKKLEAESKQKTVTEEKRLQAEIDRLKMEKEEAVRLQAQRWMLDCTGEKGADEATVKRLQHEWAVKLEVPVATNVDLGGGVKMEFVLIPPGKFLMGDRARKSDDASDAYPVHPVTITKPFYIGKYEVTQQEYVQLTGLANPSSFKSGALSKRLPVENVTWYQAQATCEKLSLKKLPKGFSKASLPTEAQWEYACRAGTQTAFHFGDTLNGKEANYYPQNPDGTTPTGLSKKGTSLVGTYKANAFGLFDLHGNVWEWCLDGWHSTAFKAEGRMDPLVDYSNSSSRVLRGGSWYSSASFCRSAYRTRHEVNDRPREFYGFRVLLLP